MIGIINKATTVQQLYEYAVKHNYLDADAYIVLDIINREEQNNIKLRHIDNKSPLTSINNTNTVDFSKIEHYTVEDLLNLLES